MRVDQQLAVFLGGDCFQIACEDTAVINWLRQELREFVVDGQGLPGYKISVPGDGNRLWVLLGSDGNLLARAKSPEPVVRTLLRHMAALASAQSEGTMRFSLSAMQHGGRTILINPELLRAHPMIERQLTKADLTVVDSPFVELRLTPSVEVVGLQTSLPSPNEDAPHASPSEFSGEVAALLWGAAQEGLSSTHGQVAHALATAALTGTKEERFDFAIEAAASLRVGFVPRGIRSLLDEAVASLR